jgi:hypothetical protein
MMIPPARPERRERGEGMRVGVSAVLSLAMIVILAGQGVAGECIDGDEYYIEALEGKIVMRAWADPHGYCIGCLTRRCASKRWAGPNTAACFRSVRGDSLRPRLIAALTPYVQQVAVNDSLRSLRREAALVLASWGVPRAGSFDVFQFVADEIARREGTIDRAARLFAAMDDARAVPFLRASYDSLRGGDLIQTRDTLVEILSGLYHLSDSSAVAFAAEIAETETDSLLVERARRVVNRP